MIKLSTGEMAKAYVGSDEVSKIYLGSDLVYSAGPLYDAEIEFLQSSGTQYINLPMTVTTGTFFEVDMYFYPLYSNTKNYTVMSASPYVQFETNFFNRDTSRHVINYDSIVGNISTRGGWGGTVDEYTHYIISTEGKTNNAGTYTALSRPLTAKITAFRIFGGYRNSNRYPIKFRKVKITAGTRVLYDLKAVRKGQVGYMYDSISNTLLGNNGSGSFTLGNDLTE